VVEEKEIGVAKIIEAKAVITADDKTGAVFDKVAKKIDQIAKSAKNAKAVDDMTKALGRAREQMAAIDRYTNARPAFDAARERLRAAQAEAKRVAETMKSIGAPNAKAAAAEMRRVQIAVDQASRAYEAQKTTILSHRHALQGMGVNISQAAAHQNRLRDAVERTNAALVRQERVQERRAARRLAVGTAIAAGGAFAAHETRRGAREVLHTYREFDKERRFAKAVMGLSDDEQEPLVRQAIRMGATTKFNDIQVLEAQRELAARGLKKDQIMGMMNPAGNLGMALDLKLPDAVKQMEGAIFGFKKDISTLPAALASAQRTADVQVKAAKISGMTPEDITQAYKYGATPARLAGVSEETLLAFAGISKKANMGGDESGVAFRALMAAAQSPTRGAKEALLANGLNFKNYQRNPDRLALSPFVENVATQYGVKLNKDAQAGLGRIFGDKAMISDPAKFTPAVMKVLSETLGGSDAKSKRSIAGMANRFRAASMSGIDTNAFIEDLMTKIPGNLQLANAIFGAKQGARIATALGDPETFKKMIHELREESGGYSEKIAAERMAGFDGAVSRFEGAVKNLETAIGRSFDDGGKGGFLTTLIDKLGGAVQHLAELDKNVVAGGAIGVGAAGMGLGGYGAFKFMQLLVTGGGLTASATALDGAAAALTAAAGVLSGGKVAGAATGAASAAAASASIWGRVAAGAGVLGGAAGLAYLGYEAYRNYPTLTPEGERNRIGMLGSDEYARRRRAQANPFFNQEGVRLASPGSISPELSRTMLYGTGVSAPPIGSAEVHGAVEGKFTVEAGSDLLRVVEESKRLNIELRGAIKANGPGSTGRSSPDAAAPSVGASGVR